jgi:hypothetical protein
LVREHLNLTARGDLEAAEANVTSDFFNHRCMDEPMEARLRGPEGHDAVRDDLGMAKQLGWIPPTPIYIVRMLFTRRRERRQHS